MRCATKNCSQDAKKQCADCSHLFCDHHIESCEWCQAYVCFECRDEHQANNPLHSEDTRNA